MNQIWVGSDWHLWNTNNNYAHPYRSDTDIKQFIDKIDTLPIQKDDLVLFLGDFADILDPDPYKIQWILNKIPGTKIMVYGNHDIEDMSFWLTAGFDGVADMVTIHHMIFTHFPIHVGEEYINFHGHLHTEKFSQLDARWVNVYNPDMPFTRLDDVLEKIQYNNHIATHTDANIFPFQANGIKDTMDKYTNVLDLSDEFPLVPQDESVIKNQEDIYYNKEKFDSGEINLCFITGHSGSGKSTMGKDMKKRGIEHYELDIVCHVKEFYTMAQLKKYGELIYAFFNGPGKRYYDEYDDIPWNEDAVVSYCNKVVLAFVNYAKQYAKAHKDQKFVIEGIWLFDRKLFKPEDFKDYAFYVKGTSMIISEIRAIKRDHADASSITIAKNAINPGRLAWYIANERDLSQFVRYFSKLTKHEKLNENVIKSQEDIYYNKKKFDSGKINLCFITGHSGSGKSTMGRDMQQHGIEHYELDDLVFIKDHFTMANLKEYGGLIYSFFNGPGKKYYITKQYLIDNNVPSSEYDDKLFVDFVKYAKQYAKSHPKTKFVLEGVWLFEPGWFKPEEFKEYAFYIKGTSMMISSIRAAKRDAKEDHPAGGAKYQLGVLRQTLAPDALKWYITNEKQIQQYVKYFTRLMKQGNLNEDSTTLNEVLFDDIADTEYWEQDDEHKLGSRKKEPMAEDYEEVKIKSTHEPRTRLKFLKEATEDVVRSLTESYITAPPTDGTADSLVAKPEVPKYRKKLWRRPLYQVSPVDPKVSAGGGSGWYSSIENAIKGRFGRNQIYVGQYYVFTLLPGHYDIRAGDDGPYWYFGGFGDEEPKIETSGIIETYASQEPYYDWVTKYPKGEHVSSSTSRFSAAESNIRNESADEFGYDSPEVEDDAFGGEEVRFFNREESYPTSTLDEEQQILTLDDPARFMNEATANTKSSYKKLYPVYINLFSNNTVFGKLIKTVTGSPYTHATIGLDSTMNNMYSFSGIPYNTAPLFLCSGFVRESIWSPAFTRCAFFHTYVTFVDKEGRDKIQKKINNFIKNYDKYDYNTPGLFEYYFGATNTKHHDENKKSMWFCSEFVTACVNASDEVEGFEDIMQSPEDLAHMPNTFDLGEWHVEDFDQKKMDILTKRAEAKFRKNPEMSSSILSEDASGSWIMDESAREKLRAVYKNAQNSGREVYNKMRQHDVHKYVFNLDWKKLHDEFVRLFPKNSPATRFDLIGLILHSYLIPTKQSIENVTENIVNQFKEIKKTVRDGYIKLLDIAKSIIFFWNKKLKDSALKYPSEELITESGNTVKTNPHCEIGNASHLDPELHADPPADYEGLTEAATQKLYPVYVLLSHRSASVLSNAIKALTHSQFSHVALSFDPKLTHMYSFGRNSPNSSKGSFRLESIKKDAYAMGEVPYSLYVVPCTAEQCKLIKKRLKYFAANKSNFTFDMAGLVKNGLGIESEPDDKWFCSRFVADVLNAGAPNGTKYVEHPSLMDPDDFRHTNFAQYVCGGLISDYDYLVAERITKDILHSAADVRSQVGHLKNENTNMIIPSYIKYHNQIWHYKYANDPEDINYPDD